MSATIPDGQWCLYLLECKNGAFYAGITNHLEARYAAHRAGKGARFTRANPPVRIVGAKPYQDRSAASVAEHQIKKLSKPQKITFILDCLQ